MASLEPFHLQMLVYVLAAVFLVERNIQPCDIRGKGLPSLVLFLKKKSFWYFFLGGGRGLTSWNKHP